MIYRIILSLFILCLFTIMAYAATIQLPQSGQTQCYDTNNALTSCAGTGQDGDKLMGVAWPVPRFKNNSSNGVSNGTVTDNLTGLIWLKKAACLDGKNWAQALAAAHNLASDSCGLSDGSGAGDWRLPNVDELASLTKLGAVSSTWLTGNGFSGVQAERYWSSTTYAYDSTAAWVVIMYDNTMAPENKGMMIYGLPVRGGQ